MALMLVASGCGGKGGLVAVRGVVTLDGQPVEGASVTFSPEEDSGKAAGGLTDSEGVFDLTTFSEGDGALPGDYRVTVTKTESDPSMDLRRIRNSSVNRDTRDLRKLLTGKRLEPRNLLPVVYANRSTTPLRWRVPTDAKKTLELNSKASSSP